MGLFGIQKAWEITLTKMEGSHPLGGRWSTTMTTESNALAQTLAYMAENRLNSALKAETLQNMYLEAITKFF